MIYEIQSKNDISAGACLVIRFPEEELDKKALYTIEADRPNFLVPFRHRSIDGQIECIYQLGDRSRLHYRFGKRAPKDYVELWSSILQPILDCGDWFLKPSSFVMETENIFIGRDERSVSYIYVPSRARCVGGDALNVMVREIAERNPVEDLDMENKVLRAIMQEIRPMDFLKMLKSCVRQGEVSAMDGRPSPAPAEEHREAGILGNLWNDVPAPKSAPVSAPAQPVYTPPVKAEQSGPADGMDRDISVELNDRKRPKHKEKPPREKKKKPERENRGGLFGGKIRKEIIGGAAKPGPQPRPQPGPQPRPNSTPGNVHSSGGTMSGVTEVFDMIGFQLIGTAPLPKTIEVNIEPKGVFTIGRFDISAGVKQSSFEFEKDTKAVSRHHAAIERDQNGTYTIVDLNSKAGTFVDGIKLTPNIPVNLTPGCRVSFGTCGADYMWVELG